MFNITIQLDKLPFRPLANTWDWISKPEEAELKADLTQVIENFGGEVAIIDLEDVDMFGARDDN